MAFQVAAARAAAERAGRPIERIALSSSGNAAIAAAAYGRAAGLAVTAFVAPTTPPGKLRRLRAAGAIVVESPNAIHDCAAWCAAHNVPNLRPSTDDAAVEGFLTLGWELVEALAGTHAAPPEALFTFVSSATSLVGIGRAFERAGEVVAAVSALPALHAVQGAGCAPVAGPLDARPPVEGARLGALGARKTRRLGEAVRHVRRAGGRGWSIGDDEADAADALLRRYGLAVAYEAAGAVAAAGRAAAEAGVRRAIVVVTGADRDEAADRPGHAETGERHDRAAAADRPESAAAGNRPESGEHAEARGGVATVDHADPSDGKGRAIAAVAMRPTR